MIDDSGRWWCDHCGGRSARGGIQVATKGMGFSLRRLKMGPGVIYCSEGCMRDALFGLAPDEDPAEALRSQIRTLQRRLRDQEQHHQDSLQRAQSEAHAHSEPIEHILGLLYQIVNERLLDDIPLDERGQRLKSLLSNACRISNSTRLFGW